MIITIDGPSAAGKGTLAPKLAAKYRLSYFDTGMTYRAVGLEMILQGKNLSDKIAAEQIARDMTFQHMVELSKHPDFRSNIGGKAASTVALYQPVRDFMTKMMRDFALNPVFADGRPAQGVVYDGRDTGTVVCPQAEIKFYITASPEIRAMRRFKEFQQKGLSQTYEEVLELTKFRDTKDFARDSSFPAADAHVFDTSEMTIDEVFQKACEIIDSH